MRRKCVLAGLAALAVAGLWPAEADSMCGFVARRIVDTTQPAPDQKKDITQPAQIAFITWDPQRQLETVTVQPRFEGNALDFGMVIPTPSRPELNEMPRDLFKGLAVFTTLKRRVLPESRLLLEHEQRFGVRPASAPPTLPLDEAAKGARPTRVVVLEAGLVGSLEYKIITADRADDLYGWLKDNKYHYGGDEGTLDFYVKKKYFFTVMKIDTMQMKRNPDGSFKGEVTPTRFSFRSDRLVYPLKITQISVADRHEALFYVQSPYKVDLAGDFTYQYDWLFRLQQAQRQFGGKELPGHAGAWLRTIGEQTPDLLERGRKLGLAIQSPFANPQSRLTPASRAPTTLEWAGRLTAEDIKVLTGTAPYSEKVPDPDDGFTRVDVRDPDKAKIIYRVIQRRLDKYLQDRPRGYLVRTAAAEDVRQLKLLAGHLQQGQFVSKFRKVFTKAEMSDDLLLVPARVGNVDDTSEFDEVLLPPTPLATVQVQIGR